MTTKQEPCTPVHAQTAKNVLALEVENLLNGWPTYVIHFTPEQPGPLKLVLHLKDASKHMYAEDSDDDNEDKKAHPPGKKEPHGASIIVTMSTETCNDPDIKFKEAKAIPVVLGGTLKDPVSLKRQIRLIDAASDDDDDDDDDDRSYVWPPPRSVRKIGSNVSLSALRAITTFPASLKVVKD